MKKEIFIVIFIIISIIVIDSITQNYTQKFFDSIIEDLDKIEEKILSNEIKQGELEKDIENVDEKWIKKYKYFACYIEHDELEKVHNKIISVKANIKVGDFNKSVDEIENGKFLLKHIEDKDSLKIVNIF